MKKSLVFLLLIVIVKYSHAQLIEPNSREIARITHDYFRSNPYNIYFSTFLNHLVNDPTLVNKTINKRTDTSFFFFKGDYNNHSPFGFKADRTEIRLAEQEVELGDSLSTTDTLLFYQLLGYSYGEGGLESVKKEFSKFDRRYGRNFYSEDAELKSGDKVVGSAKNYFIPVITPFSPISVAWAKLDDYQNVFTITIRMKVMQNTATLPIPPDRR